MLRLLAACVGVQLVLALPLDGSESARKPAVSATEFQYQVLISQLDESPKCGGALVAEGFIVTSATCVLDFGGIKKFLEEALLYGGGTSLLFDMGDVSDAVIHPKYTISPKSFDVALIKYVPQEKGPQLNYTTLNETWGGQEHDIMVGHPHHDIGTCIMTSWWDATDSWPERLLWQPVSVTQCAPLDPNLFCFSDETINFHKDDFGSPIVCGGVLAGLIPRGGGNKAINLTSDYEWIMETMTELAKSVEPSESETEEETKQYFTTIIQKLDLLAEKSSESNSIDHLTRWNNQIVVPLSYVLFALVIFFFVLLFFIILFTVVLVYYSRK